MQGEQLGYGPGFFDRLVVGCVPKPLLAVAADQTQLVKTIPCAATVQRVD